MVDDPNAPCRRWRVMAGGILASLVAAAVVAPPAGADTPTVTISGLAFSPPSVAVQMVAGEPGFPAAHAHVRWTMADPGTEHTVTFGDPSLTSSPRLAPGQVHEVVFSAAGAFAYRCTIHPAMAGTVVVSAAPPPVASTAAPVEAADPIQPRMVEVDGPGAEVVVLLVLGAGVVVAGVLLWFLRRRRRTPEPGRR